MKCEACAQFRSEVEVDGRLLCSACAQPAMEREGQVWADWSWGFSAQSGFHLEEIVVHHGLQEEVLVVDQRKKEVIPMKIQKEPEGAAGDLPPFLNGHTIRTDFGGIGTTGTVTIKGVRTIPSGQRERTFGTGRPDSTLALDVVGSNGKSYTYVPSIRAGNTIIDHLGDETERWVEAMVPFIVMEYPTGLGLILWPGSKSPQGNSQPPAPTAPAAPPAPTAPVAPAPAAPPVPTLESVQQASTAALMGELERMRAEMERLKAERAQAEKAPAKRGKK